MKWPCSLQYVGVFPKYLYTTGEGLSPQQNVKYVVKCIEMPKGQNLIEIFSPAPFRVLSYMRYDNPYVEGTWAYFVSRFIFLLNELVKINNPLDDLSSTYKQEFSLTTNLLPSTLASNHC